MTKESGAGRRIKSVEVFGDILAGMVHAGEQTSLDGVADATGLSTAKVRPYLNSLQRTGLGIYDPMKRQYAFGPLAALLGQRRIEALARRYGFLDAARNIARERDLFVGIVFWAGIGPTVASVTPSRMAADNNVLPGTVYSVTGTASGRVFMAFSSDPRVAARAEAELAGKAYPRGVGEMREDENLSDVIAEVRRDGFCFIRDAYFPGYNGMAMPVMDEDGELVCVIVVSGTSKALPKDFAQGLTERIRTELAERLAANPSMLSAPEVSRIDPIRSEHFEPSDAALDERRGVGSAETAVQILRAMTGRAGPMRLKEICDQAGLAAGKAHSYMVSLRNAGLVEKAPGSTQYRLGPLTAEMLLVRLHGYDVFAAARALVRRLSRQTGLMCFLTTWGSYGPVVVHIERGQLTRHSNISLGRGMPLSSSGTGRLFQANVSQQILAPAVAAETAAYPQLRALAPSPEDLSVMLEDIRKAGYAIFETGPVVGLRSLAAPVRNHVGDMWFAVTLTGDMERVRAEEQALLKQLLSGVAAISADLGYAPPQ
ncbi:IclR family transcriptional regulator [Celeribacter naphthalenivorans]|uniref:IclR family transcriptional regulator n=1 Tax=Celeribacter naphthalenivorans TaxID=1614694 RepID=UPI001CFBE0CC|nr:IclR family transcriptional regulator C-terminal domain-containing protein [Celeribacter naphthalenivorans]